METNRIREGIHLYHIAVVIQLVPAGVSIELLY